MPYAESMVPIISKWHGNTFLQREFVAMRQEGYVCSSIDNDVIYVVQVRFEGYIDQ